MPNAYNRHNSTRGFTLIELMICVSIIGVLAATAIPAFKRQQLRARSAEAQTNLTAIRVVQESNFAESGRYLGAAAEPEDIPGSKKAPFDVTGSEFGPLGWAPEGEVYFQYAISLTADATGFTADAAADLDEDSVPQIWGYRHESVLGDSVDGLLGCLATNLLEAVARRCGSDNSVF